MITTNFLRARRGGKSRGAGLFSKIVPASLNWGSLFFGVLVGIFTTSLVVFTFATSDITLRIPTSGTKKAQTVARKTNTVAEEPALIAKVESDHVPEPRFDFYTELAKSQPEPSPQQPQQAIAQTNKPATLDLKSAPKTINGYLVQAGHYRKSADADALRAKLALNGYEAKVVSAKERNGEVWHRIMLGPFKSEGKAKDLQKQLKNIEIDSVLVIKYNT